MSGTENPEFGLVNESAKDLDATDVRWPAIRDDLTTPAERGTRPLWSLAETRRLYV